MADSKPSSTSPRPGMEDRQDSYLPPHLRQSVITVPVTPAIGPDVYFDAKKRKPVTSLEPVNDTSTESLSQPDTTPGTTSGQTSPLDGDGRPDTPGLSLTGNVISATFSMPRAFRWRSSAEWELKPTTKGAPAPFDALRFLSADQSSWNHTVVAWTGEIEESGPDVDRPSPLVSPPASIGLPMPMSSSPPASIGLPMPMSSSPPPESRPSISGSRANSYRRRVDDLLIPQQDMQRLEDQLACDETQPIIPVWLGSDDMDESGNPGLRLKDQSKWRRYAEQELYPLFHYKQPEPTDGKTERIHWADYYHANEVFADRILERYRPGDIVLVHDYHLMLLPRMLRQRAPHIYVGFVLYCPFPSSEFVKCLTRREDILEGVLGANFVGFQTYSYGCHFASCCTRILGIPSDDKAVEIGNGKRVRVGVHPLGIDAAYVESHAFTDKVDEKVAALKEAHHGMKIIVGRDRLDGVHGITHKLNAFEHFLDRHPEWRGKVVLIQVSGSISMKEVKVDSKSSVARGVNEAVARINGRYGNLGYTPVHHYPRYLAQDEYFALLRAGDVCLSTSVREGVSTVSLEYIVCQRGGHGQLIVSEFSGTADALPAGAHINPWDWSGVAHEINAALTAPEEQGRADQQSLYQHVSTHTMQEWIASYLRQLTNVIALPDNVTTTSRLDRAAMLTKCRGASKRLFLFDYDGTLSPIVQDPSMAVPSDKLVAGLEALAGDSRNDVWIISGRDQKFLEQQLGHIRNLGFSAEHGSFLRRPGESEWTKLTELIDMSWLQVVIDVFQTYTDKLPGSVIERKKCAVTWHYRQAIDEKLATEMARACQKELELTVATKWDVHIMAGKANLEVRPTAVNKGEIVKGLVAEDKADFVFCVGDDTTDEDMFCALRAPRRSATGGTEKVAVASKAAAAHNVLTVTVGPETKPTLAEWCVPEAEDVVECVALLATVGGGAEKMGAILPRSTS